MIYFNSLMQWKPINNSDNTTFGEIIKLKIFADKWIPYRKEHIVATVWNTQLPQCETHCVHIVIHSVKLEHFLILWYTLCPLCEPHCGTHCVHTVNHSVVHNVFFPAGYSLMCRRIVESTLKRVIQTTTLEWIPLFRVCGFPLQNEVIPNTYDSQ